MDTIQPSDYGRFYVIVRRVEVNLETGEVLTLSPNTPCLQNIVDSVPCYPIFTSRAAAQAFAIRAGITDVVVECDRELICRILDEIKPIMVSFDVPGGNGMPCEVMLAGDFIAAVS